jgi:hypothetical protein
VRWARFRRINVALTIVVALLLVAWLFGPALGLPGPSFGFAIAALAVIGINTALGLWTFRAMRADATRVLAAHAGSVVFPTTITSWPQLERAEFQSAIALVAEPRGLSFRDHEDHEVQLVPADRIMSLELAPLEPRARFRPFRVTTIDGATIDFSGPSSPDAQVDAVIALRTALGRAAG